MSFEIEKKYRLTAEQREQILQKLEKVGAKFEGEDFEENVLYRGGDLNFKSSILRLRKTADKAILTYKEAVLTDSDIKQRIEHETAVADGEKMHEILKSIGFVASLVYEKRRQTWQFQTVEVVVDELPFGLFLEIEGAEDSIREAEKTLEIESFESEPSPYPALTAIHGKQNGPLTEARF
jgi:adenylate cyclase class 2